MHNYSHSTEKTLASNPVCLLLCRSSSPLWNFDPLRVESNLTNIQPMLTRWLAQLTATTFNWPGRYISSPGNSIQSHKTCNFYSSSGYNQCHCILFLQIERWPGWAGLGGNKIGFFYCWMSFLSPSRAYIHITRPDLTFSKTSDHHC